MEFAGLETVLWKPHVQKPHRGLWGGLFSEVVREELPHSSGVHSGVERPFAWVPLPLSPLGQGAGSAGAEEGDSNLTSEDLRSANAAASLKNQ